tara:strand:- start:8411 stop:8923 length:513 start_codon:yes stop_codon:yes gene_type:complete
MEHKNIYRYKFTDTIVEKIYHFSKIHEYDDCKAYKENWHLWCQENNEEIERETFRLESLGYDGDVVNKMYKSGRYYFRKKTKSDPQPVRRQYISVNKNFIHTMDEHISKEIHKKEFTPAYGYTDFCEKNLSLIENEIRGMQEKHQDVHMDLLNNKIKKTYKNRYFIISNK